jgi:hypothetical protein
MIIDVCSILGVVALKIGLLLGLADSERLKKFILGQIRRGQSRRKEITDLKWWVTSGRL